MTRGAPCRVQFDRRELGVELIKDVDVMPIDPTESLPAAVLAEHPQLLLNGRATVGPPGTGRGRVPHPSWSEPARGPAAGRAQQEARTAAAAAAAFEQAKSEADVRALVKVCLRSAYTAPQCILPTSCRRQKLHN